MSKPTTRHPPRNGAGERRREAIVEAAYALFVEKGYEAVTVDDIIRISGGSKSTLYTLFGNKEGVMRAVVEELARKMLQEIDLATPHQKTPREALTRIGNGIAKLALSESAINQYRLAVANAKTIPSLSRLWYESGPKTTIEGLADYFRKETDEGRLRVENPERAAAFFLGMIIFKDNLTMSIGAAAPGREELRDIVREAVEMFLAAYGG